MRPVLVASPNPEAAIQIGAALGEAYKIDAVEGMEACLSHFRRTRYEITFIEVELFRAQGETNGAGRPDYRKTLQNFRRYYPSSPIVILADTTRIREAVGAVKAGAEDYLTYPLNAEEIAYVVQSLYDSSLIQHELDYLWEQVWPADLEETVRTNSPLMAKVYENVRLVAPTRSTVLLTGETGTGKTLIARLIHSLSTRSDQSFIAVHCGAIQDTLIESELFGHEKGAFTGAIRKKLGKFELAKGGTLFLDEIGAITPSVQITLLQVLQDRSFQRVGGETTIEVNVRVIAATNDDLWKMADQGAFRRDLLFRLNVFPIHVPALRDRLEDVPLLVDTFLRRLKNEYTKDIKGIQSEVMEALVRYDWPGNVRELENLVERAFIIEKTDRLTPASFPAEFFDTGLKAGVWSLDESLTLAEVRKIGLENIERQYLHEVLKKHRGRINLTAANAGVTPRQIHKLMAKYSLAKENYK